MIIYNIVYHQKYKPMITKEHVSIKEDKQDFKLI